MQVDVEKLEIELQEIQDREKAYAGYMAEVLIKLPNQSGYKNLPLSIREEIEAIVTAIE